MVKGRGPLTIKVTWAWGPGLYYFNLKGRGPLTLTGKGPGAQGLIELISYRAWGPYNLKL